MTLANTGDGTAAWQSGVYEAKPANAELLAFEPVGAIPEMVRNAHREVR